MVMVICSKILLCWMSAHLNHRCCFQPVGDRGWQEGLTKDTKAFQPNDYWGIAGSAKPWRLSISVYFCLQINCTWVMNVLFCVWDSMWRCMRSVSWNSQNRGLGSGFACNVLVKSGDVMVYVSCIHLKFEILSKFWFSVVIITLLCCSFLLCITLYYCEAFCYVGLIHFL